MTTLLTVPREKADDIVSLTLFTEGKTTRSLTLPQEKGGDNVIVSITAYYTFGKTTKSLTHKLTESR